MESQNHRLPEPEGPESLPQTLGDLALGFCLHISKDGELTLIPELDSSNFSEQW